MPSALNAEFVIYFARKAVSLQMPKAISPQTLIIAKDVEFALTNAGRVP
jgi:hypothetical protein